MTRICTLLFCFLTTVCQAQHLTGFVRDARTNAPLTGVNVRLNPGSKATTTNQQGQFTFAAPPAESYQLQLSSVGYRPVSQTVTLTQQD
ncbi:MAG TPA: carboxypeptidase-like regulatory domain-containing protein, partial [Fibrella sp.]